MPKGLSASITESFRVDPSRLQPDVGDVTRCSCGPDYKPRQSVHQEIERLLSVLTGKIEPQFVYTLSRVSAGDGDELTVSNGACVEVKPAPGQPAAEAAAPDVRTAEALAAVVCSVGQVDERLEAMIETDGPLAAWIGQAIALAQLEMLEKLAARTAMGAAAERGLRAITFVEPGVGSRSQRDLFTLLPEAPVCLTEYGTMEPRMSYSFWVPLRSSD